MSETSPTEPTSAEEEVPSKSDTVASESGTVASTPAPERVSHARESSTPPGASGSSRWLTVAALVLAVLATSVAVAGWFFPHKSASSSTTYSDQQTKDAKKKMCETFMVVDKEVVRNSHLKNPENGGPIGALSVATAARLAFYGGGSYLLDALNQQPATPADLAKSITGMGTNLEQLAIGYLAGAAEFTQDELRQSLDDKIKATVEICKK